MIMKCFTGGETWVYLEDTTNLRQVKDETFDTDPCPVPVLNPGRSGMKPHDPRLQFKKD